MTHDDFDTVDGQLGVTMPAEYRLLELRSSSNLHTPDGTRWIFDTARQVVSATQQYRVQGVGEKPFPPDYVVIGETGTGDFFCLDLSQNPAPVVEFDHERYRFRVVSFSFTSWLKRLSRQSEGAT
jgi:hypothetical protein